MERNSIECLKADIYRLTGDTSWKSIIKQLIKNICFRPVFTLRMCQHFDSKNSKIILAIFRLMHRKNCDKAGLLMSWKCDIGPGFSLTHTFGSGICELAKIGTNVTLLHGTSIAQKDDINEDGTRTSCAATIGNNVWLGPNSTIVGNVNIGKSSIVGANTLVTKDVPAESIVVGNPQKVLSKKAVEDVPNKVPQEILDRCYKK